MEKDRTHSMKQEGRDQHHLKSDTNIIRTSSYTRNGENYYDIRNGDADGRDSI